MNGDMSEMINNFSKMMNNQNGSDNIKNLFNSINSNNNSNNNFNVDTNQHNNNNINSTNYANTSNNTQVNNSNNVNNATNTNNIFENIDMSTLLKMQQIMSSLNNNQNDSRANLLNSLKPYLKENRKKKVDQYIQLIKMGKILEIMNPLGGDNKHV